MNLIGAIIIGIIQGVAEWLPISSKTQVLLASTFLLDITVSSAYVFGLFMEIGSVGSAAVYFRNDIKNVFKDRNLLTFLIVVTVITGIIGVPLFLISTKVLYNQYNVGYPMLILGIILIADGIYIRFSRLRRNLINGKNLSLRDMFLIGVMQGLAALPGVSRSGMTVSTMLILGYKPEQAFRYSYLAYIPAALGATGATIFLQRKILDVAIHSLSPLGLGVSIIAAFLTGLATIKLLLSFARRNSIYTVDFVLGIVAISISALIIALG
ncbi:undecaprenyl-diphosphatase [Sulfolobales archaeon HS-7]|nr:undecaprenyl-diphosphatase [Sulfolobales archaeon HS-7]